MEVKTVRPFEASFFSVCTTDSACSNIYFTEMCSGSEAGSYQRLIDLCITQL